MSGVHFCNTRIATPNDPPLCFPEVNFQSLWSQRALLANVVRDVHFLLMKALLIKHAQERSLTPKAKLLHVIACLPFPTKRSWTFLLSGIHGRSGGNNPSVQHTKDMVAIAAFMKNYSISNIYQLEWPDCTLRNMIRKRHTDTISPLLSVVTARWPSLSRQLVDWTQYSNTDATGEPNHPPVGYHYMLHQCNKYSFIDQLPTV